MNIFQMKCFFYHFCLPSWWYHLLQEIICPPWIKFFPLRADSFLLKKFRYRKKRPTPFKQKKTRKKQNKTKKHSGVPDRFIIHILIQCHRGKCISLQEMFWIKYCHRNLMSKQINSKPWVSNRIKINLSKATPFDPCIVTCKFIDENSFYAWTIFPFPH